MNKDCEKFLEMVSASVDNELPRKQQSKLNAHLETCEQCRLTFAAFEGMGRGFRTVKAPEEIVPAVMQKVKQDSNRKKIRSQLASAASFVIVLISMMIFMQYRNKSSAPAQPEDNWDRSAQSSTASSGGSGGAVSNTGQPTVNQFNESALETESEKAVEQQDSESGDDVLYGEAVSPTARNALIVDDYIVDSKLTGMTSVSIITFGSSPPDTDEGISGTALNDTESTRITDPQTIGSLCEILRVDSQAQVPDEVLILDDRNTIVYTLGTAFGELESEIRVFVRGEELFWKGAQDIYAAQGSVDDFLDLFASDNS